MKFMTYLFAILILLVKVKLLGSILISNVYK